MVVVQIADGWVSRAGTRATHPPTHSALRAGPRCRQSSEYRASPAPRFNSEGRGAGDRGGEAGAVLVPHAAPKEHSLPIDSATTSTAPAPPPVFINLVTGKARYSEPCLSRGPARSAEWVGGSARRGARNGWVALPGAERGMGGWLSPARSAEWLGGRLRPTQSADWAGGWRAGERPAARPRPRPLLHPENLRVAIVHLHAEAVHRRRVHAPARGRPRIDRIPRSERTL